MDRLRELRVTVELAIRVWGTDATGKPFSQQAHTIEISALGGRIAGVRGVQKGDVIGVQYRDQKARFRIVWVGEDSTERAGLIGVECVEPGKCIWTAMLDEHARTPNDGPAVFTPALPPGIPPSPEASKPGGWPAHDRRRYPRFQCSGLLKLKQDGTSFETSQKLSDISLGGCYGETMAPLAPDVIVDMVMEVCGERIPAKGMVRTSHPSMGNGIGFTEVAVEDWKKLAKVIRELGGANIIFDAPGDPEIGDAIEALLSLLQHKGVHISRDEFLDELRRRMASRDSSESVH